MSEISEHIMHMRVAQAEISRLRAELEETNKQLGYADAIVETLERQLSEAKEREALDAHHIQLFGEVAPQLHTLAKAVLEAHIIEEWDGAEDQIVERPCQCEACTLAREVLK